MNLRTARLLLRLYPRAWRERYGEEFAALLAQQPLTWEGVLDIGRGAFDARQRATRRNGQLAKPHVATNGKRKEQTMGRRQRTFNCSFCGKNQHQTQRLIAGPNGVYICDECILLCYDILTQEVHPGQGAETGREARHARVPWWRRLGVRWQFDRGAPQPL